MIYFPRMLDKIRMHARGELDKDYHPNLGNRRAADGVCCSFMHVDYGQLRERVLEGGSDEEIQDWCFEAGRHLNEGDLFVWNNFATKLGWNDFAAPTLAKRKKEMGIEHRTDIATIPDLIDFDEGRLQ
jgi:gluconokinase